MDLFLTTCQGNRGNVGIQGYGLSTVRCQGKQGNEETGKGRNPRVWTSSKHNTLPGFDTNGRFSRKTGNDKTKRYFSIQDFSTSRARKLSSHGDLAYCPARRYFGENIYNFCPSRTEFATRLEVDWRKIDSFALSGETGKRRNSRVWISFNHNALPGYRKLGHRFNRFRDEGRQLLVFFSSVWRPKPHRTLLVSNRRDRWRAGNQGYGLLQLVQSTITRMSSYWSRWVGLRNKNMVSRSYLYSS